MGSTKPSYSTEGLAAGDITVTSVHRGSTFALRRSILDFGLGGQRCFRAQRVSLQMLFSGISCRSLAWFYEWGWGRCVAGNVAEMMRFGGRNNPEYL